MSAYERGWDAALRGAAIGCNRYQRNSAEWLMWRWGWQACNASLALT
jgi:hypothetical protein